MQETAPRGIRASTKQGEWPESRYRCQCDGALHIIDSLAGLLRSFERPTQNPGDDQHFLQALMARRSQSSNMLSKVLSKPRLCLQAEKEGFDQEVVALFEGSGIAALPAHHEGSIVHLR